MEITERVQELRWATSQFAHVPSEQVDDLLDALEKSLGEVASLAAKVQELTEERDLYKGWYEALMQTRMTGPESLVHALESALRGIIDGEVLSLAEARHQAATALRAAKEVDHG